MFGLRNSKDAVYGVIIDIGSGSVGVGILESDPDEKLPKVVFSHRVYMRISEDNPTDEDKLRQMREALFSASLILSKEGLLTLNEFDSHAKIGRILVTCSSPWAHTVSRSVTYDQEEEFKITRSILEDLIKTAEDEIAEKIAETAIVGSMGLKVVEKATVNVRLNGYQVHDYMGQGANTVELSHITGLVPEEVLEAVYEVQDKILTDTKISAHTFMLVMYCVLRDLFPNTDDMTIVDVTGETTEIGVINDGILSETIHAPYGSNTLLRHVVGKLNVPLSEAITLVRGYGEGTLSDDKNPEVRDALSAYQETLGKAIQELTIDKSIPSTMIVTALPEVEPLFRLVVPETANKVTGMQYKIIQIKQQILNEIALENNHDTFISVSSRFFHKLHGCGEIEGK